MWYLNFYFYFWTVDDKFQKFWWCKVNFLVQKKTNVSCQLWLWTFSNQLVNFNIMAKCRMQCWSFKCPLWGRPSCTNHIYMVFTSRSEPLIINFSLVRLRCRCVEHHDPISFPRNFRLVFSWASQQWPTKSLKSFNYQYQFGSFKIFIIKYFC